MEQNDEAATTTVTIRVSHCLLHSRQGSTHSDAGTMCGGDLQELPIWMHDWPSCVTALRHTRISTSAGCWAVRCMLHATELRYDAACASDRRAQVIQPHFDMPQLRKRHRCTQYESCFLRGLTGECVTTSAIGIAPFVTVMVLSCIAQR